MGFQQRLAHLPSFWLVSKVASLSRHFVGQGFNTWHISTTMWKASWCLSHSETHDNPTTSKITYDDVEEAFLAREWDSLHLSRKKQIISASRIFSNMNVNSTWRSHWHYHNARLLLLTASQIIDLPLKLNDDRLSLSLEIIDYATFALIIQLKRGTLCVGMPPILM